eukprot:9983205-Alexandrium_andersonii.AAC.1
MARLGPTQGRANQACPQQSPSVRRMLGEDASARRLSVAKRYPGSPCRHALARACEVAMSRP